MRVVRVFNILGTFVIALYSYHKHRVLFSLNFVATATAYKKSCLLIDFHCSSKNLVRRLLSGGEVNNIRKVHMNLCESNKIIVIRKKNRIRHTFLENSNLSPTCGAICSEAASPMLLLFLYALRTRITRLGLVLHVIRY